MNDFLIADSRRKKLIKLFKISNELIKEFGFTSFLQIAYPEFKKQKLDIFKPDPSPSFPIFQPLEMTNYQNWLLKQSEYDEKIIQITPANNTVLDFVIIHNNELIEDLLDSVNSILNQHHTHWNLFLVLNKTSEKTTEQVLKDVSHDQRILVLEKKNFLQKLLQTNSKFICFLKSGNKLYPAALNHIVNTLSKDDDIDILYTDEDQITSSGKRVYPFFKPSWSPNLFLSLDYISGFFVLSKKILQESEKSEFELDENGYYDLLLKTSEKTSKIKHIPIPIFGRKQNDKKVSNEYITFLQNALSRRNIDGNVKKGFFDYSFHINYNLEKEPKVSIIIPTKDQHSILKRCLHSIEKKTNYKNWEIIIVDNNSQKEETISYLKSLPYQIIRFKSKFNFSKINNIAVSKAKGEFLLFLNDDTAAINNSWLHEMVSICNQPTIGAVAPKLVFSDDTIQHAGVVFLKSGAGFHPYQRIDSHNEGYEGLLNVTRDYSAVTGACLLTKKEIFEQVGGFDEKFDLYYGDSDLCFKIRKQGYEVVYTPHVKLLHEGSTKIKELTNSFFAVENHYDFIKKWPELKEGDPFYNPNFGWDYNIIVQ